MKGRTLETVVAAALFFLGLSSFMQYIGPAVDIPLKNLVLLVFIAGIVSIFAALVIFWDAARGG